MQKKFEFSELNTLAKNLLVIKASCDAKLNNDKHKKSSAMFWKNSCPL